MHNNKSKRTSFRVKGNVEKPLTPQKAWLPGEELFEEQFAELDREEQEGKDDLEPLSRLVEKITADPASPILFAKEASQLLEFTIEQDKKDIDLKRKSILQRQKIVKELDLEIEAITLANQGADNAKTLKKLRREAIKRADEKVILVYKQDLKDATKILKAYDWMDKIKKGQHSSWGR